jgi:hypothetical protein
MPISSYTMPVNAPTSVVWQALRDSAEFPQRFVDGVEAVRVLDRDGEGWLRELQVHGAARREQISINEKTYTITAELVDHPVFTGKVVTRVEPPTASSTMREPRLSFRLDWTARSGSDDPAQTLALSGALEHQLLAVKRRAEAQAVATAA